jgi:glucokinase-like ROK family protein
MSATRKTADQTLVRELNTSLVLEALRTRGPLSRASLSSVLGLNRSTVSSVINDLLEDTLVREIGLESSTGGRPGMLLDLNPNGGCAVGVEIGVDFISVILTDFTAEILWREHVESDPDEGREIILQRSEGLVQEALDFGEKRTMPHMGIGVGLPGLVDVQQGKLVFAPNLKWRDVPLRPMWEDRFTLPVFVENEANAAALGEHYFGIAQDVQNLIYLSAGVGLGGGIIINGELFRGSSGYAGEIGHMTVDPRGPLCGCGKRGCWETLVGPRAIVRRVRERVENDDEILSRLAGGASSLVDVNGVVEAAQNGNEAARTALEEVGEQLGIGIANLVNAFNPELVVLGGALSLASDFLMPSIERMVEMHMLSQPGEVVEIASSAHGADACVMGAVALVLDDILRQPTL